MVEETVKMFEIWISSDGYYSTELGDLVEVKEMPNSIINPKELLAYKYNPETKLLELDEAKLVEIRTMIESEVKIPTAEERLADLEAAFLELSTMVLGGE